MATTKPDVLAAIKRLAEANGSPPGVRLFERETGIKKSDWFPALWLRWGDALQETGFTRNKMVQAVSEDVLLEQYALLARRLLRLPLQGELIRESQANPAFPSEKTFRRLGGKDKLIGAVATFCKGRNDFADVAALCDAWGATRAGSEKEESAEPAAVGYVYLLQHGSKREYKIGKTNNAIRREGEIDIELPHGVEPIHVIKTDDPAGVESYWHRRFAAKRLKGEWFALSGDEVRAFKRWRKIL
jgi:hypothetical protein